MLHRLAGGDPTRYEAVTKLNFVLCMNTLAYEKSYNIVPRVRGFQNAPDAARI